VFHNHLGLFKRDFQVATWSLKGETRAQWLSVIVELLRQTQEHFLGLISGIRVALATNHYYQAAWPQMRSHYELRFLPLAAFGAYSIAPLVAFLCAFHALAAFPMVGIITRSTTPRARIAVFTPVVPFVTSLSATHALTAFPFVETKNTHNFTI
jgi:uncharacterized membrane protein YidH (DUF202 family)